VKAVLPHTEFHDILVADVRDKAILKLPPTKQFPLLVTAKCTISGGLSITKYLTQGSELYPREVDSWLDYVSLVVKP